MKEFVYYAPTKIIFGKGSEKKAGELIKAQGCKKVLIHYGKGSVKKSGLLDQVVQSLGAMDVACVCLGGVVPNPRLSKVNEGIELCRKEQVDFILAVGGGSVIDSAKAIGYGVANGGDVWDFYDAKRTPEACLPIGAILTIAAAGSEMSNSSVITKEEGWLKRGYRNDICRCKFAILNPELTMTLPAYQTRSGCVDILLHTLERYLNQGSNMEMTDEIGEGLMRTVIKNAKILEKQPDNYEARAEIMWAGSLSHNGLTGCGAEGEDWASHQLEHELGGMFDVAHGAGLSAIWGSWAKYVCQENVSRFAELAHKVFSIPCEEDLEQMARKGIEAVEDFYRSIHMPVSIGELGINLTEGMIEELAEKCSFFQTRTIGNVKKLEKEDMKMIYAAAR